MRHASPEAEVSIEYVAAVNDGDLDRLEQLLAADVVDHHLPPDWPAGRDGVRRWIGALRAALELSIHVEDVVSGGDRVALRARVTGRHVGPFAGMPPTGRSFEAEYHSLERVVDGRIVERWEVADTASIAAQLADA